ncbi:Ig-like domain-containing protein [Phenylobacterium sp.]|uniref:Ig-like domain-containing protein n=1 Tax=Phenylobacterium sp. TaxID=1871053 RepID=UPI0037C5A403
MRRFWLVAILALALPVASGQAAETTQYTYDALGRVISAIDATGKKVAYTYDSAGNRTRVSNGAEFTEITPTAFTASSNAGTTGLTAANGMKDGNFQAPASVHATNTETNAWIRADLGSAKTVNHIDVAPAQAASVGANADDLNGTAVEYSLDGTKWTQAATIGASVVGATRTVAIGGVSLRYLRIRRIVSGQVAVGDFRFFSAAVANSPLIAQPDEITSSGSAVTFDPRTNDQDLDGYAFTISGAEDPPHGTVVVNASASITYTPDPGYFGADTFLYSVADGHNGTASARVTVLVRSATNNAPVAVNDTFTVSDRVTALVDGINSLRPTANDYDADGDVLTITAKTNPTNGTATIVGANIIEYQPTTSYIGSDSLTYTISDGRGGTSTATINLTVANSPPVAGADSIAAPRTGSIAFDPRLNDNDPNGDTITVSAPTTPARGSVALNGDQTITYTANSGAVGGDGFTYTLTDARGATATGAVTVSISPNSPPKANGDNITGVASTPVSFDPRANDIDADGDKMTVVSVTTPGKGTATLNATGTSVTYTMSSGQSGSDSFTYTVTDDEGGASTATVAVNSLNVEYLVVAAGGAGTSGGGGGGGVRQGVLVANAGTPLTATVGAGSVRDSSFSTVTSIGGGNSGASGGSGGGSWTSPAPAGTSGQGSNGGTGPGSFAYGGGGGAGGPGLNGVVSPPLGCHYANGTSGAGGPGLNSSISGTSTNYAAGGGGASYLEEEGECGSWVTVAYGAAGGTSAASGAPGSTAPANRGGGGGGGGAGGSGIVIVRYAGTPKATGGTVTQAGGYTIHTFTTGGTFTPSTANSPPVATNDSLTATSGAARVFDPRVNDTDANGDGLTVVSVGPATNGVVGIRSIGDPVIYTPKAGYTGSDSFTYTITDGGTSATATVNVTVVSGPKIEYLVVGGGGGAGRAGTNAGGGGGGGFLAGNLGLPAGSYAVVIGNGGSGAASYVAPTNGGSTTFAGLSAVGGGAGGVGGGSPGPGQLGASGGGGGHGSLGGAGIFGQGKNGGGSVSWRAGGGGGAGGMGSGGAESQGSGGPGLVSSISGTSQTFASGGGAGGYTGYPGEQAVAPGSGGANAGSGSAGGNGGSGVANRGGGGGGGGRYQDSYYYDGGAGGSGVVIVRYATGAITGATGGTITTSSGYTIHTFTSSGTFVLP